MSLAGVVVGLLQAYLYPPNIGGRLSRIAVIRAESMKEPRGERLADWLRQVAEKAEGYARGITVVISLALLALIALVILVPGVGFPVWLIGLYLLGGITVLVIPRKNWNKSWPSPWLIWFPYLLTVPSVFPLLFWLVHKLSPKSALAWPDDKGFAVWILDSIGEHFGRLLAVSVSMFGLGLVLNLIAEVLEL